MNVGDLVRLTAEPSIQQVWIIVALKTDARGIWIQFDETSKDTWHFSSAYEVISESGRFNNV